MSDIISAICDDIKNYHRLCNKYGEKVRYGSDSYGGEVEDCYGEHAHRLEEREDAETSKVKKRRTTRKKRTPKAPITSSRLEF